MQRRKNKDKVSSVGISAELNAVPKLRRRSVNDRWIPFKFPKEGGPSNQIVNKKNAQKRRTDLKASDLSISFDHRWIRKNLHVL
jgi:hypothetical protein